MLGYITIAMKLHMKERCEMRPVDFENRPAWERDKKEYDRVKRLEKEAAIANTLEIKDSAIGS